MANERRPRDKQYRAAMLEKAKIALRQVENQLDRPGGSRVTATVAVSGDPDTLTIRIEVPLGGRWVVLTEFQPSEIGMTPEDIADEIRFLRYQSGVGIPDDLSALDGPREPPNESR